jgi:hypothetical protein
MLSCWFCFHVGSTAVFGAVMLVGAELSDEQSPSQLNDETAIASDAAGYGRKQKTLSLREYLFGEYLFCEYVLRVDYGMFLLFSIAILREL